MAISPFPYQGPLEPEQVTGREALVIDMSQRLAEHRLTVLIGPRRYGKTSLLRRVLSDLEVVGPVPVWVDLFGLTSMADLAARLDDALDAVRGNLRHALSRIASAVSLTLGAVKVELRGAGRDRPDPALTVRALLEVLTKAAEDTSVVIAFDEFSDIDRVDGAAALLRTGLQHHYRRISIVFAGSEPSMMRTLFSDRSQPFFGQADLVEIGPLSASAVADIVIDGFTRTGRGAGPLTDRIVTFGGGHPQRSMQLADAAWRNTHEGGFADVATWDVALAEVRGAVSGGMERLYSAMAPGQQKVLRSLAQAGTVYGAAARIHDLAKGTATEARASLRDHGHLRTEGDRTVIVDPLFEDWIRNRFSL